MLSFDRNGYGYGYSELSVSALSDLLYCFDYDDEIVWLIGLGRARGTGT